MKTTTCQFCSRTYAGNGYKDACTRDCHFKAEYASLYGKRLKTPKIYEKPVPYEDPVQKANERWFDNVPKKVQSPKLKRRINTLLNSAHVREKTWEGKQYKSVRG